jgi:hypothetical protein
MSDQLQELLAENAALKAAALAKVKSITFKVSEKGACSVYGLGRFPVTLYDGQWKRLILALPELQEFLTAHQGEFKTKD